MTNTAVFMLVLLALRIGGGDMLTPQSGELRAENTTVAMRSDESPTTPGAIRLDFFQPPSAAPILSVDAIAVGATSFALESLDGGIGPMQLDLAPPLAALQTNGGEYRANQVIRVEDLTLRIRITDAAVTITTGDQTSTVRVFRER